MVQIRTSNKVLAALEPATFQRLLPHLEPVGLKRKQVLYEPDAEIRHIYFPETSVIVLVTMMQSGETIESATVGREGATWIPALSGGTTMPCQTMVAIDGDALRIDVDVLKREVNQNEHLRDLLTRYSNALLIHTVRSTACNGVHTLDQRCARWILTTLDRVEPNERFSITHDFLAYLLGASRQTVTTLINEFEKKGFIESDRGSITVPERTRLERAACECYGVIKEQFAKVWSGQP
jgi:CRP-like cAMP-binding protein